MVTLPLYRSNRPKTVWDSLKEAPIDISEFETLFAKAASKSEENSGNNTGTMRSAQKVRTKILRNF